jgi:glutamate racemase
MAKNKRPIAVIDSGLGGISVLAHLLAQLPNEDFVYFGDNANAPYGSKKTDEVLSLTLDNIKMLEEKYFAKAVVIACNTATGAAAAKCREIYPNMPIIGIEPAIKPAVTLSGKEAPNVLVMATPLTLSQEKFVNLAEKYNPNANLIPLPCPGLSQVIESGGDENALDEMLTRLFADVESEDIDAVVLGCTHYPLISGHIKKHFPKASIYDGGLGTALQTKRRLSDSELLILDEKKGSLTIINSAQDPSFEELANKYLKNINI